MPQRSKKEPKLLTLKQACEMLNCHPNTLRAWDEKGYLVAVRFGTRRDRRYKREDVMKLLEKNDGKKWVNNNFTNAPSAACTTLIGKRLNNVKHFAKSTMRAI